jgi:hypothetical protein
MGRANRRTAKRSFKKGYRLFGRLIQISPEAKKAIAAWIQAGNLVNEGYLFKAIYAHTAITQGIRGSQLNRIYKRIASVAKLDPQLISRISGHSFRVGAAQDMASAGASLPILLNRGRWSKTDTAMRYIEGTQISL